MAVKTRKPKKTLVVVAEFPLNAFERDMLEGNEKEGWFLEENLVGELVKIKSGPYENMLSGWIISVESKEK